MPGILCSVGLAAVTGGTAVALAPVVLGVAGFTAAGVASGSFAAIAQSYIGNVVAGSAFALLQSAGAAGLGAGGTAGVFSSVAGTVATICAVV